MTLRSSGSARGRAGQVTEGQAETHGGYSCVRIEHSVVQNRQVIVITGVQPGVHS